MLNDTLTTARLLDDLLGQVGNLDRRLQGELRQVTIRVSPHP